MQFRGVIIDRVQFHRREARFEQNFARLSCAVMNMFEVQSGVSGHENIPLLPCVFERGQAVVAATVSGQDRIIDSAVIHNHRLQWDAAKNGIMPFADNFQNAIVETVSDVKNAAFVHLHSMRLI